MSDQPPLPPQLTDLIAQLHALTDELQQVDLTACSDDDLIAAANAHEQAITRLT